MLQQSKQESFSRLQLESVAYIDWLPLIEKLI